MFNNLIRPIESAAAAVFDGVAHLLNYGGGELREAPSDGSVTLPDDLFAKADVQTEWWYYTGHCKGDRGREFGFELVFFKRRTDRDKLGIVPMTVLANPMYFAHFAISDITRQKFRYEHLRSFDKPLDVTVAMSERSCDVRLGPWSLREIAGRHVLHATFEDGLVFDAILEPAKPLVLNGEDGSGIVIKGGGSSNHFSYTRMNVTGQMLENGRTERFAGTAWMDREFGSWEHGDWDWFSIQFDDDTELMLYRFRSATDEMNGGSSGTFVMADGTCNYLKLSEFEIEQLSAWVSPRTRAEYPSLWQVRVPSLNIDITVKPLIADQELDTRGSTMIVYWEGACDVKGVKAGKTATGRAYVELVGYDKSHMQAGIGDFLFGGTMRKVFEMAGL